MGPEVNRKAGEVIEVPNAVGKYLIESHQAELVEIVNENFIEAAIISQPEKAVIPKSTGRKTKGR